MSAASTAYHLFSTYSRSVIQQKSPVIDDLVLLDTIGEEEIVDVLQRRYAQDDMYTYIGPVLIAVNPYKQLKKNGTSIYDLSVMSVYSKYNFIEVAPHIFSISSMAYTDLVTNKQDQCIIVTGESGAGKTEASKQLMQYITQVKGLGDYWTNGHRHEDSSTARSKEVTGMLLESNPVLEAFGNAQTVRNDNSSRFGKYMELLFDFAGGVVGGRITNYLPETSRVVAQADGERNFHIFHHLLAGANDSEREKLHLDDDSTPFRYLMGERRSISGMDDAHNMAQLRKSMGVVGVSEERQEEVFAMLGAVLWLGNIEFDEVHRNNVTTALVKDDDPVEKLGSVLGVEPGLVELALTKHTLEMVRGRNSLNVVQLDAGAAGDSRDTLAKAIYKRLFRWLVQTINESLTVEGGSHQQSMGILDIYGFEIFEHNSFEQFCINYVNEKLQQYFIDLTLKAEQEEYAAEGIEWINIDYFNNQIVVDLIEARPTGMLALLDDQSKFKFSRPEDLTRKYKRALGSNPHFVPPRAEKGAEFGIRHYAGDVEYDVTLFLTKNQDTLFKDLSELMASSSIPLARELFEDRRSAREKAKRPHSIGFQFRGQVLRLMDTLRRSRPHYVRCVKPNDVKRPGVFEHDRNLHQVRYLGLTENVRVRRAGFCFREPLESFLFKYKASSRSVWPHPPRGMSPSEAVRMMLTDGQLDEGMTLEEGVGFKIGRTKVFIKEPTALFQLERYRAQNYHRVTTLIQKNVRRLYQQRWYVEVRRLWILVQAAARRFVYTTRYRRMRRSAVKIQTMWRCWYLFHGYQKHLRQVHKPFIMSKWKKFKHNVLGVSNAKREVPVHPYFRLI